ncbi:MAG: hypothetical protein PUC88_03355 [Clostridia bacterium]|nr:hypothetical protein [Clostridia bacterium]
MKKTMKITLSGMICALSVVIMLLTGIITIGTYAMPAIAGTLAIIIVIECGVKYSIGVYVSSSILAFLLAPDKEAALYYVLFFGYYPIVKAVIENKVKQKLQWIFKIMIFNISMVVSFFISILVLSVPKESFTVFGLYVPWLFLAAGNIVFIMFDRSLTGIITMYLYKWRKKIK